MPLDPASARYPSLQGRVVFISGGATGIGEAFVTAFARQGAKVSFVDLDVAAGDRLTATLQAEGVPHAPLFQRCDVTDTAALQQAIARTRDRLGPVVVLVNNAASDQRHGVAQVDASFFDASVAVNLRHQFFAAQAVAPDMASHGGGSVINLGSISWMIKDRGYPVYLTCKAAIQGLTRSLARDLGKQNIRVNTLVPGWVMTEKQVRLWLMPESEAQIDEAQCLPGRLRSEHIAAMALFLAADDSSMCTAQDFVVDAGWT